MEELQNRDRSMNWLIAASLLLGQAYGQNQYEMRSKTNALLWSVDENGHFHANGAWLMYSTVAVNYVIGSSIQNSTITLNKLNQSGCTTDQIPKWNGTVWACAADAGGGTVSVTNPPISGDGTGGSPLNLVSSSATLLGPSIDLGGAEVSGSLPAASIAAGNLASGVAIPQVGVNLSTVTTALDAKQAADADLDDLADGSLTGSKVGAGIASANLSGGVPPGLVDLSTVTTALNGKQATDADLDDLADGSLTGSKVGAGVPAANIAAGNFAAGVAIPPGGVDLSTVTTALAGKQPTDADLDDLADGSLTGSKVGSGISAVNIADGVLGAGVISSSHAINSVQGPAIVNSTITLNKLNQSGCLTNEIPKWNGTVWACAADAGGGASAALTRIAGNSGAAGADITWQNLTADAAANATTTLATVMTTTGLGAGTWQFTYYIIYQSGVTTTGVKFAVNHTGTTGAFVSNWGMVTTGGTAATGVGDQVSAVNIGQMMEGKSERVINTATTASAGVDTINANMLAVLEGLVVVTATGSLELKHASETANSTQVMADTSLVLRKIE